MRTDSAEKLKQIKYCMLCPLLLLCTLYLAYLCVNCRVYFIDLLLLAPSTFILKVKQSDFRYLPPSPP